MNPGTPLYINNIMLNTYISIGYIKIGGGILNIPPYEHAYFTPRGVCQGPATDFLSLASSMLTEFSITGWTVGGNKKDTENGKGGV